MSLGEIAPLLFVVGGLGWFFWPALGGTHRRDGWEQPALPPPTPEFLAAMDELNREFDADTR